MCSSRLGEVSSRAQASSSSGMRSPLRASARRAAPFGPGSPRRSASARCSLRELARAVLRRLGEVDAPRREARVRDAELAPAGAGGEQVGPRLRVAALGEPQPAARLEQERSGQRARRRVAELVGPGEGRVGVVELVELDQGVDEERERPQHRGRGRDGQLVLEADARVGLGVARAARTQQRHGADHAAVGEGDPPAARARRVDEGIAVGDRGVELLVDDQHDACRRSRAASRPRSTPPSKTGRSSATARSAGSPAIIAAIAALTLPELRGRGAPHAVERLGHGRRVRPPVGHVLGLQARERLGRQAGGVIEHRAGDVHRRREVAAEPERAGAAQRELAALLRRGGALDGGAQHGGSVGVQVRGQRLPELAGDVGGDGRVERRLGERAAQEPRGALGRAAGAGHGGRLPQRGHGGGIGERLGPQQVHRDVAPRRRARPRAAGRRGRARARARRAAGRGRGRRRRAGGRARRPRAARRRAARRPAGRRLRARGRRAGRRAAAARCGRGRRTARASGAAPSGSRARRRSTLRATCSGPKALSPDATSSVGAIRSATRWPSSACSRNGLPPVTAWQAWANEASACGSRARTSASAAAGPSGRGRTGGSARRPAARRAAPAPAPARPRAPRTARRAAARRAGGRAGRASAARARRPSGRRRPRAAAAPARPGRWPAT